MCVPLAEKDALWVVESVEVGLCDKELHAVAEPLGEPEDDEDTDDVRQRVEDGLLLLEPVKLPFGEEDGHLLPEPELLPLAENDALVVEDTVVDRHSVEVLLPVSRPLDEPERVPPPTEEVAHSEKDGLLLLKPERLLLADKDIWPDCDAVEVRHKEGVPLPDRDAEGEPEGEKVPEDVRHSEVVRLPLLELERLLLDENVTLTVAETVEVGHSEEATLPLRKPLGDGDSVPEAEKLFPPEELQHCVEVTVEERQRDGEPLPVRDTLGETVGDKDAEDEWHSDDSGLPLGRPVRLLLVVNVTVALSEAEEEDV